MTVTDTNNIPQLAAEMDTILDRVANRMGAYMEAKLVAKITHQDSSWAALDPKTIKAKKGSTKAWIDSGELRTLITRTVEGSMQKIVKVGIFNHKKGIIAHFLEFGTSRGIPERPLFRLVFDMEKDNIDSVIRRELDKELKKYMV